MSVGPTLAAPSILIFSYLLQARFCAPALHFAVSYVGDSTPPTRPRAVVLRHKSCIVCVITHVCFERETSGKSKSIDLLQVYLVVSMEDNALFLNSDYIVSILVILPVNISVKVKM
jgi:hypothetical protein